ncbi:MAG TPA: glycosyltransferase [Gemmataceae bacterium]|nr:glycosyltransferase [Gemmataceae bacterium]
MDTKDPRVAIVMITHNRREELLRTLERLTGLPEQPGIVVVDNGCTDATAEAVAQTFPQVNVVRAGANLGAAGRTLGARHTDAPYLAFCDDDTWWDPGALRRAADLFDRHPKLAALTGRVLIGREEREDPACTEMARSPLPREPQMPGHPLLGFLAGASMMRRSAFFSAGGFTAHLGIGGEEQWLAAELAAGGWWLCYVPEIVIHHYPSTKRDARLRRRHDLRNTLWFTWLRRPLPSALRRTLSLARSVPCDWVSVRGFVAALTGLPSVWRYRHVVPPDVELRLRLLEIDRNKERKGSHVL